MARELGQFGIEVHRGLAKTGVVGVLKNGDGPSIGLRADMDALPIHEANDFDHRSKHDGKMHACGHDGHTSMLLGAAKYLAETRQFKGTINFIFQPAEEGEAGARVMIEEGLFDKFPCQSVYGVHNMPGKDTGTFHMRTGALMAAYDTFEITVTGRGSHAAMPHHRIDPVLVASKIVGGLQSITSRNLDPLESAVISVTQIHGGDTNNVIPDRVWMEGTTRSFKPEVRDWLARPCNGLLMVSPKLTERAQNLTIFAAIHRRSTMRLKRRLPRKLPPKLPVKPGLIPIPHRSWVERLLLHAGKGAGVLSVYRQWCRRRGMHGS